MFPILIHLSYVSDQMKLQNIESLYQVTFHQNFGHALIHSILSVEKHISQCRSM